MDNDIKKYYCYFTPFRPVAETSRMMHYVQLITLFIAGVVINYFRGSANLAVCILPLIAAVFLEKVIAFCRCGGHRGSTAHTLILTMIVCFILPTGLAWWILLLAVVFSILYKHALGGLGGYFLHPVLPAIAGVAFFGKDIINELFVQNEHITGTILTMDSSALEQLTMVNGSLNVEDLFVDKLPTLVDCLLGRDMPVIAACPAVFAMLGVYCIYRGYLNWRVPLTFLLAVIMAVVLFPMKCSDGYHSILASGISPDAIVTYVTYHIFTGYIFFLATVMFLDTTSRPITARGQVWAAFIAGTAAIVLRLYAPFHFAEVFSMALVGAIAPSLNMLTRPAKRYS